MLTPHDKSNILVDCLIDFEARKILGRLGQESSFQLYAWRPGSDDVKIIAAVDDESAARIAVRARMDHNEMSEMEALEHVTTRDDLRRVDLSFMLFQGEAPLWDGLREIEDVVKG